jgi:hypothetical protein
MRNIIINKTTYLKPQPKCFDLFQQLSDTQKQDLYTHFPDFQPVESREDFNFVFDQSPNPIILCDYFERLGIKMSAFLSPIIQDLIGTKFLVMNTLTWNVLDFSVDLTLQTQYELTENDITNYIIAISEIIDMISRHPKLISHKEKENIKNTKNKKENIKIKFKKQNQKIKIIPTNLIKSLISLSIPSRLKATWMQPKKISPYQINSGLTEHTVHGTSIIIYRQSEWDKILIHELLHALHLDLENVPALSVPLSEINSKYLTLPLNLAITMSPEYPQFLNELWTELQTWWLWINLTSPLTPQTLLKQQKWSLMQASRIIHQYGLPLPLGLGSSGRLEVQCNCSVGFYYIYKAWLLNHPTPELYRVMQGYGCQSDYIALVAQLKMMTLADFAEGEHRHRTQGGYRNQEKLITTDLTMMAPNRHPR